MMIAYCFNENKEFTTTYECQYLELEGRYGLPANATFIEIPEYNPETQKLLFNNETNQWAIEYKTISGLFFDKSNGSSVESVFTNDADNYTEIEPPVLNDGDTIYFDNESLEWKYSNKGSITLNAELMKAINLKQQEVEDFYNNKRVFTIRNGISLTIKADADYADQVQNWLNKINRDVRQGLYPSFELAYYAYLIPTTGNVLNVPSGTILQVQDFIVERRAYCRANADYHKAQIAVLETITDVENYDYTVDSNNIAVVDCPDIVISI